jgi:hypothetical protein
MKYLRLSLAAGVLSIMLANSALAGVMPFPGIAAPEPPSAAGEMPGAGIAPIDLVTAVALNLGQSVLSLF